MSEQRGILILALVGLILVSAISISLSELQVLSNQTGTVRTIQVSGTGSVSASPNEAILNLAVQTQDAAATNAVNENAAIMNNVMKALATLGINQSEIQTSTYSLTIQTLTTTSTTFSPMQIAQLPSQPNSSIQYVVTNGVQVTLTNTMLAGTALDAAVNAGANEVNGITFTFTPQLMAALQKLALQLATQDALNQANIIASTAGLKIIGPTSITPSFNQPVYQSYASANPNITPIQPGTLQMTAQIQATYEFTS